MKAEIAVMTAEHIDMDAIARGGEILKNGGLVAFPTETGIWSRRKCTGPKSIYENICGQGKAIR